MNANETMRVFAGRHSQVLAGKICDKLGIPLGKSHGEIFPDGETIVELDEDVRGKNCFVILSTCSPVNDNLMELMVFCDCLKRASAGQIICVMPYFGYGRQDRKDKGRVPITAKLVANLLTKAGADRILGMDFHAAQLQGFFDIPVDHLSASTIFLDHFEANREIMQNLCFVSPDVGNLKVAQGMATLLKADLAVINKKRINGEQVEADMIIGDVKGKTVIMFDDMISTASTICQAAQTVIDNGASRVIAAATHGVLVGRAIEKLTAAPIDELIVTNSIPIGKKVAPLGDRFRELCTAELFSEAIRRIHNNESVSALLKRTAGTKR